MAGRPTKRTPEVIRKIEEIAALDGSVAEMALYADIHPDTIYAWMKEDQEFSDRIHRLRQQPVLLARRTVVEKLGESYSNAMDYIKRKKRQEFGDRSEVEVTSPKPIMDITNDILGDNSNEEDKVIEEED